jgi:hypothetical protein
MFILFLLFQTLCFPVNPLGENFCHYYILKEKDFFFNMWAQNFFLFFTNGQRYSKGAAFPYFTLHVDAGKCLSD